MLPVVAGAAATRRQIFVYSLLLMPVGAAPWLFGYAGLAYGVTALVAGALMVAFAWRVWTATEGERATAAARQLFAFSILYLFVPVRGSPDRERCERLVAGRLAG